MMPVYMIFALFFLQCSMGEQYEMKNRLLGSNHGNMMVERRAVSSSICLIAFIRLKCFITFIPVDACLRMLYVIAFTSGLDHASTFDHPNIKLQYNNESVRTMTLTLYDRPGFDFQPHKGDLWDFSLPSCITCDAIMGVSVVANGDDGWNIESIITLVRDTDNRTQLLTQDFGVDRWIDSEEGHQTFNLTLSRSDIRSGINIFGASV